MRKADFRVKRDGTPVPQSQSAPPAPQEPAAYRDRYRSFIS